MKLPCGWSFIFTYGPILVIASTAVMELSKVFADDLKPVVIVERLENGLSQVTSKNLVLVTDLPVSSDITDLCTMFDEAMPQWGEAFGVASSEWIDAHPKACLIVDRQRFIDLKYITPDVPTFREGYQLQDRLFMLEQPSPYYRRHLLLHEGTHWFLWKFLGGNGPPWFSEGMCEMMATHQRSEKGNVFRLNWIPTDRESVPFWGRLKVIRDSMAAQTAPSLDRILQFGDAAHLTDEPYCWSWAAMVFFLNNVRCSEDLKQAFLPNLKGHVGTEHKLSQEFKDKLRSLWPDIQAEWTVFVNELDYGFSLEHSMPKIELSQQVKLANSVTAKVRANHGWQTTGVRVLQGDRISILATGRVVIRNDRVHGSTAPPKQIASESQTWKSEPQGITLQYIHHFPLGKLIAVIIPTETQLAESDMTIPLTPFAVGNSCEYTAEKSGILLMKLNESSNGLFDNSGEYSVTIARASNGLQARPDP